MATSAYLDMGSSTNQKDNTEEDIRAEIVAFRRYPRLDEKTLTPYIILKASELRGKIAGLPISTPFTLQQLY